jgi:hypothetical protein
MRYRVMLSNSANRVANSNMPAEVDPLFIDCDAVVVEQCGALVFYNAHRNIRRAFAPGQWLAVDLVPDAWEEPDPHRAAARTAAWRRN